ncbi:MAG: nitroreductase family protein, partial [Candidatus Eisenbacteria bacterium]
MKKYSLEESRSFLKDTIRLVVDFSQTDQSKGVPPPPIEKPFSQESKRVHLPSRSEWQHVKKVDVVSAIESRRSHRNFTSEPATLEELSFLLWATQGMRQRVGEGRAFRMVPSAGCRHALETYLCVLN